MRKKAKVSKVTIARLYNLGNYEHVRYELTADVPAGISAKKVTAGMIAVLNAVSPKCPVNTCDMDHIQDLINATEERQKMTWGPDWKTRLEESKDDLKAMKMSLQEWKSNREAALKSMDDLTGNDIDEVPF